jgi:hypothetical protein
MVNLMQTTSIEHQPVLLNVPSTTVERYVETSEDVEQMLGLTPGPEFLMGLAVEHEDPQELSTLFLGEIIAYFGKR